MPKQMNSTIFLGLVLLAGSMVCAYPQTRIDLSRQARNIDFSAAPFTKPSKTGTALPAACSEGETFFLLGATPGQNLHLCTADNTWTQLAASTDSGIDGGFTKSSNVVQLTTSTDSLAVGGSVAPGKLTVAGTSNQVQTVVRGHSAQAADLLQLQKSDGSVLAKLDKDGFLAQGIGTTGGHAMQVGNPGDSGSSSITVHGGTGTATAPFLRMLDRTGNSSFLFPCGGQPGRWCQDAVLPGVSYTNPLLSSDSADTVSNKTLDNTNRLSGYLDWSEISQPGNPAAGSLRVYARSNRLCWIDSAGAEKCSAGGVSAPASASTPCSPGQQAYDANYFYVCVANNTWRRSSLSSW